MPERRVKRGLSFLCWNFCGKKSQFFTIKNWKSPKRLLFQVPEHTGYSLFEDPERSGHSLFECPESLGNPDKVIWVPWAIGHSNKEYPEHSWAANKEYPVCSGTSKNNLFGDFQLLIVKNCDFFPQKFQHKNERPFFTLRSGISYKPIGKTVHPWHIIEHTLWIL